MADFFQSSPNYTNPDYATPEQLATQRAYAAELMKRSGQPVNRPLGVAANLINSLTAGLERNQADKIQSEAASRNASDQSALISQLQGGQKVDPNNLGRIIANPLVSPEQRALAIHLMTPKPMEDAAGRPGFVSPVTGAQGAPVADNFEPGIRPSISTPDATISAVPQPAPALKRMPITPTNPQGGAFGGLNFKPEGWGNPTPQAAPGGGGQPPDAGLPPASAAALRGVAGLGRELSAERERTQAGAGGEATVIKQDVENAALAPETLKGLGIIKDNINRFGDNITFGPTSQFTNELKRLAANYAPGPMKEQLGALAAADSIEKVNLGLAGALAKQVGSGTQGELFKAMGSVPGMEKSKDGALALINMLQQSASKQQALGQIYQDSRGNLAAYQMGRQKYLTDHPVINPLTGNPIEMDIEAARKSAPSQNAPQGPAPGTIFNGFRFKGGNPKQQSNWEPVT